MRRYAAIVGMLCLALWLVAGRQAEADEVAYDPADLQFSGDRAPAIEEKFVETFPNRASGQVENRRAAEGLIRQLQALDKTPTQRAPYLYFAEGGQQLPPGFIILALAILVLLFLLASYFVGRKVEGGYLQGIVASLPHFLALWLPLLVSLLILYLFVAIGLIDDYDVYPATFNDPAIQRPQIMILLLWAIALGELFQIGRRLTALYLQDRSKISFAQVKSLALLVVGLGTGTVLMVNPMSIILLIPLVAWLFIGGRHGWGKLLDLVLLLLGASLVVMLLIYLDYQVLENSIAVFWTFLLLVSIRTIPFTSAVFITAFVAAGLSLVIPPANVNRAAKEQIR